MNEITEADFIAFALTNPWIRLDSKDTEEWMELNGISPELLAFVYSQFNMGMADRIMSGERDMHKVFFNLCSGIFQLGWEAHKHFAPALDNTGEENAQ